MRPALLAAALAATLGSGAALSATAERADLYGGVNVGMSADAFPAGAYKNLACIAPKGQTLTALADFKSCAADADGLHELRAAANEPGQDDTLIAGHPVDLTLGVDDGGRLKRIVIETKRKGPMFMRKKGFLLGLQARARYGDDGWDCKETPLASDEEPLGPSSVKEHCVKTAGDRRILVDRNLYRKVGAQEKDFTSESRVTIDWVGR